MNEHGGLEILNMEESSGEKNSASEKNNKKGKKTNKKRKKSFFKKGLIFYLVMLTVILVGIVVILWRGLADYQAGIDAENATRDYEREMRRAPQICFQNHLAEMTEDDWVKVWYDQHPLCFDSEEQIRSLIREHILNVETQSYRAPEYTEDNPVYLIKNDDIILAVFSLAGEGVDWQVASTSLELEGDCQGAIDVPVGSTVYCNGIVMDESLATSSDGDIVEGYEDSLVNPVQYNVYSVEGLIEEPLLTADIEADGYAIAIDHNGRYYMVMENGSDYKEKAENFIKSLLNYYTMGKNSISENMVATLNHVASSSNAASVIRASYDGVLWANYTAASYETWTSEVYVVADNCLAVDVFYYDKNEVTENDTPESLTQIYRVYFLDLGSGYKIYSFSLM